MFVACLWEWQWYVYVEDIPKNSCCLDAVGTVRAFHLYTAVFLLPVWKSVELQEIFCRWPGPLLSRGPPRESMCMNYIWQLWVANVGNRCKVRCCFPLPWSSISTLCSGGDVATNRKFSIQQILLFSFPPNPVQSLVKHFSCYKDSKPEGPVFWQLANWLLIRYQLEKRLPCLFRGVESRKQKFNTERASKWLCQL